MSQTAMTRAEVTRASAGTTEILAAPGTTARLMVKHIVVTIHTFATSGKVFIMEGTTEKFAWDATAATLGQPPDIHFPEGWDLAKNAALQLKTEGAIEVFAYAAAEVK